MTVQAHTPTAVSYRRRFLRSAAATVGAAVSGGTIFGACSGRENRAELLPQGEPANAVRTNFRDIYLDPARREAFAPFLKNVFHLYPEHEFHDLISRTTRPSSQDRDVYLALRRELPELAPFLSELRYALPALKKQKQVMKKQTLTVLQDQREFRGYLEIGSPGRYLSALRDSVRIDGPVYTSTEVAPSYSFPDLLDREQLTPLGTHVPMSDYDPVALAPRSVELITVYIGFHHCPLEKRRDYIASVREALAPGGLLVLRDHNVDRPEMLSIVGLAHDVFNAGTGVGWDGNARELRNFYPLDFIIDYVEALGFRARPFRLLQDGDPTQNTLMAFEKA